MKSSAIFAFVALAAGALTASASSLAAEPYLFEMLDRPTYHAAWNTLFVDEEGVDTWLTQYADTRNGPAGPGSVVVIDDSPYQLNTVCKTHDCGDNRFLVLFTPDGTKAWGMLLKDRRDERYFGHPDEEIKNALRSAAYQ